MAEAALDRIGDGVFGQRVITLGTVLGKFFCTSVTLAMNKLEGIITLNDVLGSFGLAPSGQSSDLARKATAR